MILNEQFILRRHQGAVCYWTDETATGHLQTLRTPTQNCDFVARNNLDYETFSSHQTLRCHAQRYDCVIIIGGGAISDKYGIKVSVWAEIWSENSASPATQTMTSRPTPTAHCWLEGETAREGTGHKPSYAQARKMKWLTHSSTPGFICANLGDCSSLLFYGNSNNGNPWKCLHAVLYSNEVNV